MESACCSLRERMTGAFVAAAKSLATASLL
jgi:hypothetical protein